MSTPPKAPIIRRETDDRGICLLTFDRPESGANIFDATTFDDLESHLDAIEKDKSLRGLIIISAKKSIFIAGADLKTLLRQARSGELRDFIARGQRAFNRIVALPIPSCAAIHGACAGGGYEITLACDYRVASEDPATRIGLPETTLGLVPAWGGATRLPRLIGIDAAADVILKGKLYAAGEAKRIGLVDEIVPRERLLEAAKAKLSGGKRPQQDSPPSLKGISVEAGANAAPSRALEIIRHQGSVEDSLRMELDAIAELGETDATQNLIRNFFLGDKYRKGSSKTAAEKIVHAAVIGAGVMGSGIAQWLSSRGVTVILRDVNKEQIDRGLSNIDKIYGDAVKRGILTEEKSKEGRSRIVCSTAHTELRAVGIIIEAASEKLAIKKAVFRELSAEAPDAILATNTSALSIAELSKETSKPERVVGLHFFNPVSRMKLIEVVVGDNTADATRDAALAFARQVGKLPVVVRDRPGFLVNRVLFPYLLDAAELYDAGIDVLEIDRALTGWGMPMGPLRLIDEIGVDITIDIAATLEKAYGRRDKANELLHKMRQEGLLGRKTGAGFYKYEGKAQSPNESLEKWRGKGERFAGDIAERLLLLMINEAARCLEEGVVASPEDADYGMVLGTGFPPFRGGPLRVAEAMGLKKIVQCLEELARGDQKFAPCDSLKDLARTGATFYDD